MEFLKRNIKTSALILLLSSSVGALIYAATATLSLDIVSGAITIGADISTTIAITVNHSSDTGELQMTIATGTFAIEDLDGMHGYYTTIQAGKLFQQNGTGTIPANYITYKAGPIIKLLGADNSDIKIGSGINGIYGNISTPQTYFYKKNGQGTGIVGRYSDYPTIKITVPSYTPAGTYQGKIYFIVYK